MSYEYTADIEIEEDEAKAIVREVIERSETVEFVSEDGSTLNVIYPVRSERESPWSEDVQFVFSSHNFSIVIHAATRDEREELIKMLEQAFEGRGIDLKLEEE
ncbi:MAG: hypothetical protein QM627_08040 [Luteolibacter sp.]